VIIVGGLEHRAKKWEPVFCKKRCDLKKRASRKKVGTGFLQKAMRPQKRASRKKARPAAFQSASLALR